MRRCLERGRRARAQRGPMRFFFPLLGSPLCFAHRPERSPSGMVRRICFPMYWASPSGVVAIRLFLRGDRRRADRGLSGATMRSLFFCVRGVGSLCFLFSKACASAIFPTLTALSVVFPALSVTNFPVGGVLKAILSHLGLSCTILEAILGSLGPSWNHLRPSWALQLLAKRSLQAQRGNPSPKGEKGV